MGWFDSPRENPLIWAFSILSLIVLIGIGTISSRTAISHEDDSFYDDEEWEEGDEEEEDDDDDYVDDDD